MGCQRGMPQQGVRTRSCLYPRKSDMIPWPVDLRMSLSWGSLYSKTPCVRAQNIRPNVRTWWARTLGSQEMLSAESLEPSRAQSLPEKGAMLGLRGTRAASVSRKKKMEKNEPHGEMTVQLAEGPHHIRWALISACLGWNRLRPRREPRKRKRIHGNNTQGSHGDRISPQTRAQDLKFKGSWVKYHKQPCLQSRKESSLRPNTALIPAKKSQPRKIKMLSSHCVEENS